ncbi:MAG: efflux transporter outer membrane subunit [Robiginitomaculum sp.]|nr:efflux transporter outer membrane subunit [Robiginitomaculum sp.]
MRRLIIILASTSMLGACASFGDASILPSMLAVPASTIAEIAPRTWRSVYESNENVRSVSWVASFGDVAMENLVAEALANNHNLAAGAARVEQAMALARISYAARLPVVSLGANGSRALVPNATDSNTYSGNISASWEADIWGRVRDRAKAGAQDAAASQADYDALRLSIAGQTAIAWIDLIAAAQQEALAADDVATREGSFGIVERRYRRGLSTALDIRLARSALAGSRAGLSLQKQQHANAARRLEILLGRYPGQEVKAAAALPVLSPLGVLGTPSDLLTRRPDIRSAEQRLSAAGFRVSDARKALLPSLSLSGSATTGGTNFGDLFDFDRAIGQLLASVAQPLFRGGAIKADIARNEAAHREQLENYAAAVLVAWRETEDALSGEVYLAESEAALQISAYEANEAQILAEREYGRGVGTIFELLDAQRRRISAEEQLITASSARASNRVSLFLALGGDTQQQAVQTAELQNEGR